MIVDVAIREVSEGEQKEFKRPRFVAYDPLTCLDYIVFGSVQGGDTREEAVFWAERLASKNGLNFERPEGWGDVEGELPPDDS